MKRNVGSYKNHLKLNKLKFENNNASKHIKYIKKKFIQEFYFERNYVILNSSFFKFKD